MKKITKPKIKKIIIFKQGISFHLLEETLKGSGKLELEFKTEQMNDVIKSLTALDQSEKGYISSISYDAAIETYKLLESVMLDIPDMDSFTSLVKQIKGAPISLTTSEQLKGTIIGIELNEKLMDKEKVVEKQLTLLRDDGAISMIPFDEIKSFNILNESIKKDLKFYLDTIIAGKKKDVKNIVINCESGGDDSAERPITISYLHETPVWKINYRIIMSKQQAEKQECILAGFSLIENVSNVDWDEVYITLVSGMTVSFIYNAYPAIYINRPVIEPPRIATAKPTEIEEGLARENFRDYEKSGASKLMKKKAMPRKRSEAKPTAPMEALMSTSAVSGFGGEMDEHAMMEKMVSQTKTKTKDLGEIFEYNIDKPVSIKRKHSAIVPILTEKIKAKKILLYNKNQHDKNPDACLEVTNDSDLMLERGPVTIIYDNNLAGEAILPFMNKEDTRLLNYAVEQAVIITSEDKSQSQSVHRLSISGAYCYEYYYSDLWTTYKINNKTSEQKELYLDHPKKSNYDVKESPIEPEETPNYWRFKLTLKPKDAIQFKIKERSETYSSYYIYNYSKEDLLKRVEFYVRQRFINEDLKAQLNEIGVLIGDKNELQEKKSKLEDERYQMTEEQDRIRENIKALGETSQESKLREKYVKKFSIQEERYEAITKEIDELEKKLKELNAKIDEKIQDLKLN